MTHIQRNVILALTMGFILTVALLKLTTVGGHWYLWWPLFTVLSYPISIQGNLFSLWGGSGPADVYSLFGVYQDAGKNAFSISGVLLHQRAEGFAFQLVGLVVYQRATEDVGQLVGIALYQRSGHDAGQFLGIIVVQDAGEESYQFLGVSLFRRSRETDNPVFGLCYLNFASLFSPFIKRKRFV